jgi:16S rRNA A1518/A1519 N6-dimethyltransferase RsmA/KsgA/DIM1 with predicted DNA glycosylase/AP lyase activity
MEDAREWGRAALEKRPERPIISDVFSSEINSSLGIDRVLELGSGFGFLPKYLLERSAEINCVALDFSG